MELNYSKQSILCFQTLVTTIKPESATYNTHFISPWQIRESIYKILEQASDYYKQIFLSKKVN
jgi:hypothetical protein